MMRTLFGVVVVAALALPCIAQKVDYSREQLDRVFSMRQIELGPRPAPNVRYGFGYIELRALGMDWRLLYLPIAMPLSGSRMGTTNELPDPFALTGTYVAATRQPWHTRRQVSREVRRINNSQKNRLIVRKQ